MDYRLRKDVSSQLLKNYGFKYGFKINNYAYILVKPVYNYNKKPVLFVRYMVDLETNYFTYVVVKSNGEIYGTYYNNKRQNDVINIINKKIKNELISMSKHNIIKKIKKSKK